MGLTDTSILDIDSRIRLGIKTRISRISTASLKHQRHESPSDERHAPLVSSHFRAGRRHPCPDRTSRRKMGHHRVEQPWHALHGCRLLGLLHPSAVQHAARAGHPFGWDHERRHGHDPDDRRGWHPRDLRGGGGSGWLDQHDLERENQFLDLCAGPVWHRSASGQRLGRRVDARYGEHASAVLLGCLERLFYRGRHPDRAQG